MHRDQNVASADELVLDVELGDGGPVGVLLDSYNSHLTVNLPSGIFSASDRERSSLHITPQRTCSQLLVLQHVECGKLLGVDALHAENLDARAGEAALRRLRCSFHEENHGGGPDGLGDCASGLVGQETAVGEGLKPWVLGLGRENESRGRRLRRGGSNGLLLVSDLFNSLQLPLSAASTRNGARSFVPFAEEQGDRDLNRLEM